MSHFVISIAHWFTLQQRTKLEKLATGKEFLIGKITLSFNIFFLWETFSWVKLGGVGRKGGKDGEF